MDGKDTTLFVSFPREKVDIFAHLYFYIPLWVTY